MYRRWFMGAYEVRLNPTSRYFVRTISEYILMMLSRIGRDRPLFRDEYYDVGIRLVDKFCTRQGASQTKKALGIDCGIPGRNVGHGRFINGRWEVDAWIDPDTDGPFCLISKENSCHYCKRYVADNHRWFRLFCDSCDKTYAKILRDEREAKELRSLTRKLEKKIREKVKATSSIHH